MGRNICGPYIRKVLQVILLVPRILRWLSDYWKFVDSWCNVISETKQKKSKSDGIKDFFKIASYLTII
jgi:hypothetical protein